MKISIYALYIPKEITGIGYYTLNLIKNIPKVDRENKYFIHIQNSRINKNDICNFNNKNIQIIQWQDFIPRTWIREFIGLVGNYDVIHFCNFNLPKIIKGKSVVTIHDIRFLIYPDSFKKSSVKKDTILLQEAIKRADKIISVSENTKKDLIEICKIQENKIKTIYEGVNNNIFKKENTDKIEIVKNKYNIDCDYIFSVGSLHPIKNYVRLIRAFSKVKKSINSIKLVIAGKNDGDENNIKNEIEKLNLGSDVKILNYVKIDELPALYSGAKLFVFPSLYEGFGLPLLEAMACECPVVASNTSSLPEVVGEAGLLFNPKDETEIANTIEKLLSSERLAKELSEKSLQRAKQFSWEKAAQETIKVYKEVM